MTPTTPAPTLIADQRVNGRITFTVRGPIGSYISAKGTRAEVERAVEERPDEGAVDRYLDRGVAAISIWADLQPGEQLPLSVKGDQVYLMASSDAVWALHGTGELRYTHYYQLLNQVENQQWANEMLTTRRFTWNQPPGWSPILTTSNILVAPDLHGALLILHVLLLVGLSSLHLTSIIAPRATRIAWSVPALLIMVHALLMFEPGSQNFPDSLFAAAILGVWCSIAVQGHSARFGIIGLLSQALRWPGAILSTVFLCVHHWWVKSENADIKRSLQVLWGAIGVGILVAGLAMLTGDAEDLLFILYFETFPEHWHGNFNPLDLLSRIPNFFKLWTVYTGGMLILSLPFAFNSYNKEITPIVLTMTGYALLLGTIDHHPSHYFLHWWLVQVLFSLPVRLVFRIPPIKRFFIGLGTVGTLAYLWSGVV